MKAITQATENRIKEMERKGNAFSYAISDIYNTIKDFPTWTLKELKENGIQIDNEFEVQADECFRGQYFALGVLFPEYITANFCLDIHSLTIYDFNSLVKAVSELEDDGWGTY